MERGEDLLAGRLHVVDPPAVVDRRVDDLVLGPGDLPAAGAAVRELAVRSIATASSTQVPERLGDVGREERPPAAPAAPPRRRDRPGRARRGGAARARRRRSSRCRAARRSPSTGRAPPARSGTLAIDPTSSRSDHDDEAQDDRVAVAPPGCRVDEDRRPDDVADDPVDDLDRDARSRRAGGSTAAGRPVPVSRIRSPSSQTTNTSAWTGLSTSQPAGSRTHRDHRIHAGVPAAAVP